MRVVISSGHGKYVRGASGYLDEVDEARRVVEAVADQLVAADIEVLTYHDDVSRSQDENLERIVDFHNAQTRDLDVSVHFNAYETTSKPMGTECLYVSQEGLAREIATAIANAAALPNRGPKYRGDLYFLNNTEAPAILIETCFVDSSVDAEHYHNSFHDICEAVAETIAGENGLPKPPERPERPEPAPEPPSEVLFSTAGKCSHFGGPEDTGVDADEGLAFISEIDQAPHLFLPYQPEGTSGLARRLNPYVHYIACRWDYEQTPRELLRVEVAWVRSKRTGYAMEAFPADWGPHEDTGRVADLSPGLMNDLDLTTDDEVEVIFPWRE